jgi:hypothetical protein
VRPERVRGAVFARHQRQVQQFAARQRGADRQARTAALFGVDVVLGDGDELFVRQMGFADQQAGHQLGERGDGQHGMVVLAEQHFVRVLVDDQRDARLQVEHVVGAVQAGHLAEGLARRGSTRTTERRCTATTVLPFFLRMVATTLRPPRTTFSLFRAFRLFRARERHAPSWKTHCA